MPGYRLTSDAKSDLIGVRQYGIQHWGVAQSNYYLSELRLRIQLLVETPNLGKRRSDVAEGVRSFSCGSHIIYYIELKQYIAIFAILHQRMAPLNHLLDREID